MMTQKTRYALKALFQLAKAECALSATEIAERERIPRAFLDQIMAELRRGGVVDSLRGRSGGYALSRPADSISMAEVMRLIDGPMAPLPCLSKTAYRRCEECVDEDACALRNAFSGVYRGMMAELERLSLAAALASPFVAIEAN